MVTENKSAEMGNLLWGGIVLAAIVAVGLVIINGVEWATAVFLPFLAFLALAAVGALALAILPLAFFRRTRGHASFSAYILFFIFGLALWGHGIRLTFDIWGPFAVVIGLLMGGVGVIPIAMLATLLNGMWGPLATLVTLTALMIGSRSVAMHLLMLADTPAHGPE